MMFVLWVRAGGGMAAYVLAKAGLKVALLEAGPMYTGCKSNPAQMALGISPRGPAHRNGILAILMLLTGWQLDGEPYTHKNKTDFTGFDRAWWWPDKPLGTHFPSFRPNDCQA